MSDKTILVTGATGHQGGATLRHLANKGFRLRAVTRNPDSEQAKALSKLAEVVKADFDDPASIEKALEGAWGVFAVQNTWEAGVEKEEQQGKHIAKLAREKGVQHFVYSSVGSAHRKTGIPHFDNKARVEETVRGLKFPSHVILRPVYFMENLLAPHTLQGDKLAVALDPKTKLQMIAVDDIGKFGALAFEKASELDKQEIDLAGDAVTIPEAAAILSQSMGKKIEHQRVPIEAVRGFSEDMAIMLEWFDRVGYDADIAGLPKKYGIKPRTLQQWSSERPSK